MSEGKIKGAAIREIFAWYEERYGRDKAREMARRAPDEFRPLLDPDDPISTILASSWYPAPFVHAMLDIVTEGMSEPEIERLAREANRAVVANSMKSVYRFVIEKLATPEIYAASIPRLWRLLHDTGDRRIEIVAPGEAISTIARWSGHHHLLCLLVVETMCAVFETMGCRNVKNERISCVSNGARECVTRVTWRV